MSLPRVELWTDGSGMSTGGVGGWAFILRIQRADGEWVEREESGSALDTNHNRMEVTALIEGLRALKCPCHVQVFSDSEYTINPLRKDWLGEWVRHGWPSRVKNVDLWREMIAVARKHVIECTHVKGHRGTVLNERCDYLAGQARLLRIAAEEAATDELESQERHLAEMMVT
jgi:ribonuclease HI